MAQKFVSKWLTFWLTFTLSFEEVRKTAADKSRQGFTAEVKALIEKYGAEKLSSVKPEDYEAFMKELEEISHAG